MQARLTEAERARRAAALRRSATPRLAATPAMQAREVVTDFAKPAKREEPLAIEPKNRVNEPQTVEREIPVNAAAPGSGKRARRLAAFKVTRELLQARYPLVFGWARPLAIGIREQLRAAYSEDELGGRALNDFLRFWTHRPAYRAALERGDRRINLDGSDAGPAFEDRPEAAE